MELNVVRRITIQATQSGVDQTTNSLNNLASAQDGVAISSEKITKSQLSMQAALDRQQRSLDQTFRSAQQFAAAQRVLDQSLQQGLVTAQRYAELSALNAGKHKLATDAANDNTNANSLNRAQLLELGHAAKAAFEQVAAGAPIMRVLAQQGATTAQALSMGSGGLGGSLKGIAAMLGTGGMIAVGLAAVGAAAAAYYVLSTDKGPTLEKTLNEQARLIGLVKDAYRDATDQAGKFYSQSKQIVELQAQQTLETLQGKIRDQAGSFIGSKVGVTSDVDVLGNSLGTGTMNTAALGKFKGAFDDLIGSVAEGGPAIERFRDAVADIGKNNPELARMAAEFLTASQAIGENAAKAKDLERSLRVLRGTATQDDRDALGLSKPKAQEQISAYAQLIQKTKDRIEELKLEALTAGQTSDAIIKLKLQHDAERAAKKSGIEVNQAELDYLKEELALRERLKNIATIDAQIKFDRDTMGLSSEDIAIASQLRGAFASVGEALKSPQAEGIRLNNLFKEGKDIVSSFGNELVSGLLRGQDAMKSMESAATSLIAKLASKNLTNFLNGGSIFGKQDLNSAQGAVGIASAGVAGYSSANPLTGALGGALAGATFGPWGAAIGGAAGLIGGLIGQSQKADEELKRAQQQWAGMTQQVTAFNQAAAGMNVGPLTNQLAKRAANDNKKEGADDRAKHRQVA